MTCPSCGLHFIRARSIESIRLTRLYHATAFLALGLAGLAWLLLEMATW